MKKTILAIGAHPDDIEIGCGGTLAQFAQRGHEVIHVIITSGEEGSLRHPKANFAKIRESEAKASANILGSSKVIFFRECDGLTSFSKASKIKLISLIRKHRPNIVFTHAKSDHFPDHQIVHQLSRAAIIAAGGPWFSGAGTQVHQVKEVYGYEVWHPISDYQIAIDISSTMEQKVKALQAHQSQIETVDYVGAIRGLAKYRGVMTMTGKYAEVFELYKSTGHTI